MAEEDWCRNKLGELLKDSNSNALKEVHSYISKLSSAEVQNIQNIVSPILLDLLENARNSEITTTGCEILSLCFSSCSSLEEHNNFRIYLERSLKHSNKHVQIVALNDIARRMKSAQTQTNLGNQLTLAVIALLGSSETSVGASAIEILSGALLENYDDTDIQRNLTSKLESSDVARFRVYEIAVNLAKNSSTMLEKVTVLLNKLLEEMDSDDILLQLNVLELLVSLAEQNHGLVYLENRKVFEKVVNKADEADRNPLASILIPGIMKFFGKIAYSQPQKIITGYPKMLDSLFELLNSRDLSILPTAFDTLGNVAHSSQGKILLELNYSERMKQSFEEINSLLSNLPSELKTRAFSALSVIFAIEGQPSAEIGTITKKWYSYLSAPSDLSYLLEFCKNPFPEIKVSSLLFVKTLCSYRWGILALKQTAGFVEYLLDRRVEFDKEALFAKFDIISILAETTVFDAATLLQLRKYLTDGVLYVEGVLEIAVEGS